MGVPDNVSVPATPTAVPLANPNSTITNINTKTTDQQTANGVILK